MRKSNPNKKPSAIRPSIIEAVYEQDPIKYVEQEIKNKIFIENWERSIEYGN